VTDPGPAADESSLFHPDNYAGGCPYERFGPLRDAGPVSWQGATVDPGLAAPDVEGGWWVHRYDDVRDVLRDPQMFSSQAKTAVLMDLDDSTIDAMSNMLINMDPPAHSRFRRFVSAAFTPRRIEDLQPRIEQIATEVIDAVAATGACDGVTDIAAPMPMRVIAELLGIPERTQQLFDVSNRMVGAVDSAPEERALDMTLAGAEIHALGLELAGEKRAAPDDPLLSAYDTGGLDGADHHAGATDDEVGWFFLLLAVAGNETVRTATGQAIRSLADHPDQRDLLVADVDGMLPGAIEEILRFRSPVRAIRRTAMAATEIDGAPVGERDKVVCHFSSALRDERQFDRPDVFDITRPIPKIQLAFGYGEHFCLGASLARLQLRTILREIYTRIPDVHPVGEIVGQPTPLLNGLLAMPVEFTPET
jgi:cholest-4-en-3-one 26-monooxygenase